MATEELLALTEEEEFEINTLLCMLHIRLNGKLKSITVQGQRAFINYGRSRDKIVIDLAESDFTIINKDELDSLNEKNNVSFCFNI